MFDELKKVNIETYSDSELRALIHQTSSIMTFHLQATQELLRRCDNNDTHTPKEESHQSSVIAIANGRKFPMLKPSDTDEEDFDVILDTTTNSLRFRKDPAKHTKLKEAKREKLGPHRMKILARMLKRPGVPFHAGNIGGDLVAGSGERARNTFSKSIAEIRVALGQKDTSGPYIEKRFDLDGITDSIRGCIYKINPKWQYLLIRHRKISG